MEMVNQTLVLKLTKQEQNIINYCSGKSVVPFEELAQFAKDPMQVKLSTLQKAVSDLKKKYRDLNLTLPFNCQFVQLAKPDTTLTRQNLDKVITEAGKFMSELPPQMRSADVQNELNRALEEKVEPKLVQLRVTRGGNRVPSDNKESDVHIDFKLEPYYKRVRTKTGTVNLSDNEWELFTLLHLNADKMLSLEDIKNVVFKNFGSKTPHHWADTIKRTLSKLRTNIRELKIDNRLVTVMGGNTTYYMLK